MFADDLRKSILQAAIQGKLSKQLPSDGDARDLLREIQAEKSRLIREKKIKPEKPLPPIKPEEIPFDIPQNWCWVRLGDIALRIHYGFTASANFVGNVKLLRITDIQNDKVDWEKVPRCNVTESQKNDYLLHENDLVIARTGGTIGKTFVVENLSEDAIFASYLIRAVFDKNISAKFIKHFSGSPLYWQQISEKSQGTGQPNVNGKSLSNLILPLPPLAEQKRIVEKVDALLAEISALAEDERELAKLEKEFPQKIKASLLQAAIQGKLSKQLPTDGDARDLLREIQIERAKLIEEKKIKTAPPLPPIKPEEIPFDIPQNWCWVRLGDICTYIQRGKSPIYSEIKKYPVVAQKCNQLSGFSLEQAKFISPDSMKSYDEEKFLKDNDLLWNSTGLGTVGRMAIYDSSKNPYELAVADSHVTVIRPFKNISYKFIFFFVLSPTVQSNIDSMTTGSTKQKELATSTVKKLLIPLPPLAEQERIVARLEELLAEIEI